MRELLLIAVVAAAFVLGWYYVHKLVSLFRFFGAQTRSSGIHERKK